MQLVRWYNTEHRHSGIGFVTPQERHQSQDSALLEKRHALYEHAARTRDVGQAAPVTGHLYRTSGSTPSGTA